jgi:hypothetical protein
LAICWHVQYYYYVQRLEEEYVDESVTRGRVKVNTCSSGSNTEPLFSSQIQPQIPLCKKKITITSKYRHMHEVLNVDEI